MPRRSARLYAPATSCATGPTSVCEAIARRQKSTRPRGPVTGFVIHAKCGRGARRVQLRGAARRLGARRTFCTLSAQARAATKQLGPSGRSLASSPEAAKINAAPRPGDWFCYPREVRQGDEKGPAARRRPKAGREAYFLYVERPGEGGNEAAGPFRPLTRVLAGSRKNQRGPEARRLVLLSTRSASGGREGSSCEAPPEGWARGVLSVR